MLRVTSAISVLYLETIHLSSSARSAGSAAALSLSIVRFIWMKRDAFQILLQKLRLASTRSVEKRMSFPGLLPVASVKRSASAPYWSMISSGSMPLPSDLLILRPCASRRRPWIYTVSNGVSPMCSTPEKIMRATQKKMIS